MHSTRPLVVQTSIATSNRWRKQSSPSAARIYQFPGNIHHPKPGTLTGSETRPAAIYHDPIRPHVRRHAPHQTRLCAHSILAGLRASRKVLRTFGEQDKTFHAIENPIRHAQHALPCAIPSAFSVSQISRVEARTDSVARRRDASPSQRSPSSLYTPSKPSSVQYLIWHDHTVRLASLSGSGPNRRLPIFPVTKAACQHTCQCSPTPVAESTEQ
ncbi:hypothetical protein C2E23DRAFT_471581 [Lenzites betulinus]|nr:hypothetical protein C2E23DRAFT_471581 [Lenzites betulinus]